MSSIALSPKYGVNPTIPVCFWCGEEKNEIALLGRIGNGRRHEDFEAPMHMVLDYEPCDKCGHNMSLGFTLMEATDKPNSTTSMQIQSGVYPTGRYVVLKREAAVRIFGRVNAGMGKAFMSPADFKQFVPNG